VIYSKFNRTKIRIIYSLNLNSIEKESLGKGILMLGKNIIMEIKLERVPMEKCSK
jgi:hypothetical protein